MATRPEDDHSFLFAEDFEDGDVAAFCEARIGEFESDTVVSIVFRFRICVQGILDEFDVTVSGAMENPIGILLKTGKILLHYGGCVAFHAGLSGFRALKRAYRVAKASGEANFETVADKLRDEKANIQREVKHALKECIGHALLGSVFI
jgi:hypothetical protein